MLEGLISADALSVQVYARYELPAVTANSPVPSREKSDWFGVELHLTGPPLRSAQFVPASKVSLHLCIMCHEIMQTLLTEYQTSLLEQALLMLRPKSRASSL